MCGRRYLTLRDVQAALSLSPGQVLALVASGALPAFQVLGEWRVEDRMLELYVERCYQRATVAAAPAGETLRGANLTRQQAAILELLADGLSNAEIADRLTVEVSTVKTHVSRLLQRFDLRDREQLIAYAWRNGLAGRSGVAEIVVE